MQSVIQPIEFVDPYVVLDYGDRYLDVQDHLTHCISIDLWCDLHIYCIQPCHNVLVFNAPRELTLVTLYLPKYDVLQSFRPVQAY